MTCPSCRSTRLLEIGLQLHGTRVTMHSCPACERHWWENEGEPVTLPSVLELVAAG